MYEISRGSRGTFNNNKIITYTRTIREGSAELEVESGAKECGIGGNTISYFRIQNKNPNAIPMRVDTFGVNGSEGFEIIINSKTSVGMILVALKFIRKVMIDCFKGKIF